MLPLQPPVDAGGYCKLRGLGVLWFGSQPVLKGSWDLVSRVITGVTILITPRKVLITLLTKSHDPPSQLEAYVVHAAPVNLARSP